MKKKTFTDLKGSLLEVLQHSRGNLKLKKTTLARAKPGNTATASIRS